MFLGRSSEIYDELCFTNQLIRPLFLTPQAVLRNKSSILTLFLSLSNNNATPAVMKNGLVSGMECVLCHNILYQSQNCDFLNFCIV